MSSINSKTYKTALVLIPPEEAWEPIQAIRLEHDRQFLRWMPHINLLYPFVPHGSFSTVRPQIEDAMADHGGITIRLEHFHGFDHGSQSTTIWLEPEPKGPLTDLQARLQSAVPHCNDTSRFANGFTPHLSVGQARGKSEATQLIAKLQANWRPLTFEAIRLSLIYREDPPVDTFRVADEVRLKC